MYDYNISPGEIPQGETNCVSSRIQKPLSERLGQLNEVKIKRFLEISEPTLPEVIDILRFLDGAKGKSKCASLSPLVSEACEKASDTFVGLDPSAEQLRQEGCNEEEIERALEFLEENRPNVKGRKAS